MHLTQPQPEQEVMDFYGLIFPNWKYTYHLGDEPNTSIEGVDEPIDVYSCYCGGGQVYKGNLILSDVSLNQNVHIFICKDWLKVSVIKMEAYCEWTSDGKGTMENFFPCHYQRIPYENVVRYVEELKNMPGKLCELTYRKAREILDSL